jgi:lysophospholipid acyltransferase
MLLSLSASLTVWARVWFYCLIGVAACFGFLNSPLKPQLVAELKKRSGKPTLSRASSYDGSQIGGGVPDDPVKELSEIMKEARAEFEKRKRRGSTNVPDFKLLVQSKIDEWKKLGGTVKGDGVKAE